MLFFQNQSSETAPSSMRLKAFIKYFEKLNTHIYLINNDDIFLKKFIAVLRHRKNGIFISMPEFSHFWVFIIPNSRIILDIRDGWSIAQDSGYGGTTKPKKLKAKLSRLIERFIISRSILTITCTPGLQTYLSELSKLDIVLIPNGISQSDLQTIQDIKDQNPKTTNRKELVFCCAGRFSQYGIDKVRVLLNQIAQRYSEHDLILKLIGSDFEDNKWTIDFFHKLTKGKGRVEILPKLGKKDLFLTMLNADYGLAVIRDPNYDFGTKIYDYIALGLPVINYFEYPNNFTKYFDACLDVPFNAHNTMPEIRREVLIISALAKYFETEKL